MLDNDNAAATRKTQRQHWDDVALSLPDLSPAASTQYYRNCEIALIKRSFGCLSGKRVLKLDLWNESANTRILNWMKSEGAYTVGLDISQVTASRAALNARMNGGPLHVLRADIRDLPFPSESFDFVYTMGTIEHIDEYDQAVAEVRRVLRQGGKAIIGVPHKWNVFLRPALVWVLDQLGRYAYSPEKSFGFGELKSVVEGAGLRVVQRDGILAFPALIRMAELFCLCRNNSLHKLTRYVLWPFSAIEPRWRWTGRLGYLIAVVAEKSEPRHHDS
jgi:SAM-dependent methyltransferase